MTNAYTNFFFVDHTNELSFQPRPEDKNKKEEDGRSEGTKLKAEGPRRGISILKKAKKASSNFMTLRGVGISVQDS